MKENRNHRKLIKMKRQRIISQVKVQDKTARKTTNWSGEADLENRVVATVGEGESVMKKVAWT